MPNPTSTFIFIDCENVPKVDLAAIEGTAAHVTLLLGKNQTKLDVKLVGHIKRLHAQVELVTLEHSGRNALDLTLAYYLGRAAARTPDAAFAIVSKDKDYTPLLAHIAAQGIKAARYDALARVPGLSTEKPPVAKSAVSPAPTNPARKAPSPVKSPPRSASKPDRSARIIARLRDPQNKNRPGNRTALRAHVKTALGKQSSDQSVDSLITTLQRDRVIHIGENDAITYLPVSMAAAAT